MREVYWLQHSWQYSQLYASITLPALSITAYSVLRFSLSLSAGCTKIHCILSHAVGNSHIIFKATRQTRLQFSQTNGRGNVCECVSESACVYVWDCLCVCVRQWVCVNLCLFARRALSACSIFNCFPLLYAFAWPAKLFIHTHTQLTHTHAHTHSSHTCSTLVLFVVWAVVGFSFHFHYMT